MYTHLMPPKNETEAVEIPSNPVPVIDESAQPSANWTWSYGAAIFDNLKDGRNGGTVPA